MCLEKWAFIHFDMVNYMRHKVVSEIMIISVPENQFIVIFIVTTTIISSSSSSGGYICTCLTIITICSLLLKSGLFILASRSLCLFMSVYIL
jgi:hypothetical protein